MQTFLQRFQPVVAGVLQGFDRLRFRGSKRQLGFVSGMSSWLGAMHILRKEYKEWAKDQTEQLYEAIEERAKKKGVYRFLNNCRESKEEVALQMAAEQRRTEGLIAVLGCVEPCQIIQVRGHKPTKKLELQVEPAKCKHYYHYYLDKNYGLRYTRLQSWLPYTMHIGLNGRDWLAKRLDRLGIDYRKQDNCFPSIADFARAQRAANQQTRTNWSSLLDRWAQQSNPLHDKFLHPCPVPYYWSVESAEYATDIAFHSVEDLQRWYPLFVRHACETLQGSDVLRFLSYRVRQDGRPRENLAGEVTTRVNELVEGTRVKHQVVNNLLKMYDKFGVVLRLETLLRDVRHFKVYRTKENDPDGPLQYLRMRQGVADLHQRAEASRKITERYAESLATIEAKQPLSEVLDDLGQRKTWKGRSARALNPVAGEDVALLEAVSPGEFQMAGFCNSDIRMRLFGETTDATEQRRQAAKVTRLLRLLRAHSLITKRGTTHRYQLSGKGRHAIATILAARQANTKQLLLAA
jgi:ribosomal protein L44E